MTSRLTPDEQDLFRAWMNAHGAVSHALDADLQETSGLSLGEYQVFLILNQEGPQRMSELATHISLSKSAMTRRIDHMTEMGWVERKKCPTDLRGFTIDMTSAGRGVFKRAAPGHLKSIRTNFLDQLGESDQKKLLGLLHKLAEGHVCPTQVKATKAS